MTSWTSKLRGVASRAALAGALVGLFAGVVAAAPAAAAPDYSAVLHVTKSVQNAVLAPTDTLAYTIAVECLTDDCVSAQLVDAIPAEFDALTLNPTVVVTGGASTYSWGGTNNRTLTVNFTKATPSGPGIPSGDGYSVQVSLVVPGNLSPDWPSNGVPVTNTATVTATTAATASAAVAATITVPYTVATTASAAWSPPTTQFKVGELSNLTLTTRNTSNAKADTLTLLAPTDPTSGTNLFEWVNFASFGAVTFPAGADRIQVDAYVAGSWINGAFDTVAALPAGVTAGQVTGLRLTFGSSIAGAQLTANGSAGSVVLNLAQRATTRTGATSLVTGAVATADVRGTVSVPGHGTQSANASATYTIGGLTSVVSGSVVFSTPRIPAGGWTISTITGRNASNGNLTELTVTQPADTFLTDKITFGGFTAGGAAWPAGATSATVTWLVAGQAGEIDPDPIELTAGDAFPATPTLSATQSITGFSIQFRGTIPVGAAATVPFRVNLADDAVASSPGTAVFTQTAQIDGANDAGAATPVTPSADLTVLYPQVAVALIKTVTPTAAVPAGGRSVVQLRATTSSDSGYLSPTSITITDAMTAGSLDYWRAFDAVAIAPTQIPAGATLLIESTTNGTDWTTVSSTTAGASAIIHQEAPVNGTDLVGLRFTFTNTDGFSPGGAVQANIAFVARATLRGTADPTSSDGTDVTYLNNARADAVGEVVLEDGSLVSSSSTSASSAVIKTIPSGPGAGLMFDKTWVPVSGSTTVSSQSRLQRTARLSWGSEIGGYDSAVVSDPADPTAPVATTVFQAFDLKRIQPINSSNDPYIAYDKVTNVELYVGGAWVSIYPEACPTAAACTGQFLGYTLSTQESTDTTGVRLTFAENSAARGSDPLAPPIGSGIASGPDPRTIDLTFQIRNRLRDAAATADPTDPWVTGDRAYNNTDPGSVLNTAVLAVNTGSLPSSASILILDPVPAVSLTKAAQPKTSAGANLTSPVSVPVLGDVAATSYPSVQYTMTATNASAAQAWYLRVTDQMPCSTAAVSDCAHPTSSGVGGWTVNPYQGHTWDPATSPFQYLTIRGISYTLSAGSGIDPAVSTVVLWYADGTNAPMSLSAAVGLSSTSLVNVVGVSALFGGTSNADGGTIVSGATATLTLDTRLRQYLRSDSSTLVAGSTTVTNSSFAQAWDGVLNDTAAYAAKSAAITLVDASLAVTVSKSASVTTILEANRTVDSNVTLTANQSTSTASPRQVVIQDIEPTFWNAFELRSLTSVSKPTGADSMRVDVQLNGSSTWTLGTVKSSSPTLPSGITNSQVTGLRVTYYKADGSLFSVTSPASSWTTSVVFVVRLRAAYRDGTGAIPFPATITNTATATSDHPTLGTKTATANRAFTLDPGTFKVDVQKYTPVKTTPAGETVNFSLISTNTGTGYLDNPVIVDQLPLDAGLATGGPLLFDPTSEITYSTSSGGILSTTSVGYAYNPTLRTLTFSWPAGARLAPGEIYTIVIPLQIAPGLPATYGDVLNRMTFSSDRTLAASGGCTNTSGNGEGVTKVGAKGCSTSNDVTTVSASAISSFKGVKGNVDADGVSTSGAVNVNNVATACVADGQGFYRNPCAAYSVVGGTDLWKLQFTNGGNVPSTSASIVDVLPKAGDVYLGTGASRGSTYRPVFAGGLTLATDTAGGTTYTWEVTTTANPCPSFTTNGTCSTATWVSSSSFSGAYGTITAIRVNFTFPGGELPPGATLAVTYQTVNTPTTTVGDGRAPVTAPLGTPRAWNSFGVDALFPTGFVERRVEPVRAGVQLSSGPIQVSKVILGSTASYAPTSFAATASCTVAGVPVVLPASGALTLAAINAIPYTARIDGIPVGSTCQIVENTTGASSVSYSPAGTGAAALTIAQAGASTAPVPAAQVATITNTYDTTDLTITKAVVTTATAGQFGPFAFTLACTVNTGSATLTVPLAAGDASFTLEDTESHTVTGLPVTARCALREADSDGATTIGVRVDSGSTTTVVENAPATIVLGTSASYTATVTNTYSAGRLAIHKDVAGAGEADYAGGTYIVAITCSYDGQTLFDDSVDIVAAQTVTLEPIFPIGTACDVSETATGGATTPAADASVTIGVGTTTTILTNRFDTGTLSITKSRTGAWDAYGAGPFEAHVVCTWDKPGNPAMLIALPNSGYLTLDSAHGYAASVTGLIAGADCSVTETKTGAATTSTVSALTPRYIPDGGTSTVTITNDYATGSLRIDKVRDIAPGAEEFANGPFAVAVACGIDRDGTWYDLDLGADATQTLSTDDDYTATVSGILQGASCTVTETDAGLAITSDTSPEDGTVVIPAAADGPAVVTVTNHFLTGKLDVEKTVAEALVQGGDTLHYTIDVANVGDVEAGGVTVTDAIDPALNVGTITGDNWTCDVAGRDGNGYGGTLACDLTGTLPVGASAPTIAYTAELRATYSADTIDNTAVVASTTVVVAGDRDTVSTPVKWLAVDASSVCVLDAPWLDYTVDAHNLDVAARTMHVSWLNSSGDVVHTDDVPIAGDGTVTGRLLWPGAAVDGDGNGVAWPGWRPAAAGETPDWENLVLDPTLSSYGLRSGASVRFAINPSTTVTVTYPPATASCGETPEGQNSDLWMSKTASTNRVSAGDTFTYTMQIGNRGLGGVGGVVLIDDVPQVLRILSVTPTDAADASLPGWVDCVVSDRLPSGLGGVITCELDRPLGYNQQAPDVLLDVQLSPNAPAGAIINTAKVTGYELPTYPLPDDPRPGDPGFDLTTLALHDSAVVETSGRLAATGSTPELGAQLALILITVGGLLVMWRRSRTRAVRRDAR
ncbi:MAG: DUF5979 domain-containing protein [Pseudolysinimonas sp.]|uniref:DUF5979 domain-containing protein n=1 Tax=Pseudolysinimonas sp. TaxID=2680009 RepID=UPI00326528E4